MPLDFDAGYPDGAEDLRRELALHFAAALRCRRPDVASRLQSGDVGHRRASLATMLEQPAVSIASTGLYGLSSVDPQWQFLLDKLSFAIERWGEVFWGGRSGSGLDRKDL